MSVLNNSMSKKIIFTAVLLVFLLYSCDNSSVWMDDEKKELIAACIKAGKDKISLLIIEVCPHYFLCGKPKLAEEIPGIAILDDRRSGRLVINRLATSSAKAAIISLSLC